MDDENRGTRIVYAKGEENEREEEEEEEEADDH